MLLSFEALSHCLVVETIRDVNATGRELSDIGCSRQALLCLKIDITDICLLLLRELARWGPILNLRSFQELVLSGLASIPRQLHCSKHTHLGLRRLSMLLPNLILASIILNIKKSDIAARNTGLVLLLVLLLLLLGLLHQLALLQFICGTGVNLQFILCRVRLHHLLLDVLPRLGQGFFVLLFALAWLEISVNFYYFFVKNLVHVHIALDWWEAVLRSRHRLLSFLAISINIVSIYILLRLSLHKTDSTVILL